MSDVLDRIPTLSLTQQQSDPEGFAEAFGRSFQNYGFAIVSDHGVDQALVDKTWELTRQFFALPVEAKNKYALEGTGGARGYTPFGIEIAKDADKHDLKEFWHVGRDLPPGHRFRDHMPDNVWPSEVAGFKDTLQQLFAAFDTAGNKLLSAIARYLGLAPDWFEPTVENGNSVLRLLHYPPIPQDATGVRAGAHGDINTITLLMGAEEGGLELQDRNGEWLPINPPPGCIVINIGDMLERLTNHVLPSTIHRVQNPPPERRHIPRYSTPFFLHFASDYEIKTLPNCITPENPDRYPESITADEFLQQRLREIKLA